MEAAGRSVALDVGARCEMRPEEKNITKWDEWEGEGLEGRGIAGNVSTHSFPFALLCWSFLFYRRSDLFRTPPSSPALAVPSCCHRSRLSTRARACRPARSSRLELLETRRPLPSLKAVRLCSRRYASLLVVPAAADPPTAAMEQWAGLFLALFF